MQYKSGRLDFQFLAADIKKHESRAPRGLVLDTYYMAKKVFLGKIKVFFVYFASNNNYNKIKCVPITMKKYSSRVY